MREEWARWKGRTHAHDPLTDGIDKGECSPSCLRVHDIFIAINWTHKHKHTPQKTGPWMCCGRWTEPKVTETRPEYRRTNCFWIFFCRSFRLLRKCWKRMKRLNMYQSWKFTQMLELIDIHSLFNSAFICKINCFLSAPPRSRIFNAIESITTSRFANTLRTDRSQQIFLASGFSHFAINNGTLAYLIQLYRNQSLFWFGRFDAETGKCCCPRILFYLQKLLIDVWRFTSVPCWAQSEWISQTEQINRAVDPQLSKWLRVFTQLLPAIFLSPFSSPLIVH